MNALKPAYLDFDPSTRRLRIDPHEPAFVQDPYQAYAWLHAKGGAFFWEEFGFWCVGSFDPVNRLLRDRRLGRQKPVPPESAAHAPDRAHLAAFDLLEVNSLLELEPPAHTRLRGLVTRAFVSRQVEKMRPGIEALAHRLIDRFEEEPEVDLIEAFAAPLPVTIIAGMLGIAETMAPQLLAWSHAMMAMYILQPSRATADAANAAARDFAEHLRGEIALRRARPGDDLLSLLVAARENGNRLSEDEIVASAVLLLNAGHEATVHQTGNAVKAILDQGGDPGRFFATPEHAAATVEECLRFDAPLHMFTRYAYQPVDLGHGIEVKVGERIALLLACANHDPAAFVEPSRFDPGRADQKNASFGAGIHFCVGAPLARLELEVSLKILFERLPLLRLAETPLFRDTYHFHGLDRLMARPKG